MLHVNIFSLLCVMPTFNSIHNMVLRALLQTNQNQSQPPPTARNVSPAPSESFTPHFTMTCYDSGYSSPRIPIILPERFVQFCCVLWGLFSALQQVLQEPPVFINVCIFFEAIYLQFNLIRPLFNFKMFQVVKCL